MGRRPKITPTQWEIITQKLLTGAGTVTSLAAEYQISKGMISKKIGKQKETLNHVAKQKVAFENSYNELDFIQQGLVNKIAEKLKIISSNLADGAASGSATFRRLSGIAQQEAFKIDPDDLEGSEDKLRMVAALTRTANEAAAPGQQILGLAKNQALATEEDKTDNHVHRIELVGLD